MQKATDGFGSKTVIQFAVVSLFLFLVSHSASAQHLDFNHADFSGGAGFSAPVYDAGSMLNYGWNLNFRGGVAITPLSSPDVDFTYSNSRFNDATLASFGEPDAGIGIWSLTFDL